MTNALKYNAYIIYQQLIFNMESDQDSTEDDHFKRYYFHTHVTSLQLHQFCGDFGYVTTPNDQVNVGPGDRIVRVAIGKKLTDVRGLNKEAILALIPKKDGIRVSFDVLTGVNNIINVHKEKYILNLEYIF